MLTSPSNPESHESLTMSVSVSQEGTPYPNYSMPCQFQSQRTVAANLSSGLHVHLYEMQFATHAASSFAYDANPFFFFGFVLQGTSSHSFRKAASMEDMTNSGPLCSLYTLQGEGTCWYHAGSPVRGLSIGVSQEGMHQLFGDAMSMLPKECHRCNTSASREKFFQVKNSLTASMQMAAHQALRVDAASPLSALQLESSVLELLALFADQYDAQQRKSAPKSSMSPLDRDILQETLSILQREYVEPPTIRVLSRRVGMNECKLKRLFKQYFNVTIYGYILHTRMLKAKTLLEQGMSVSQVASQLGYVNIGHFATAYRKHHGHVPSAFKKRRLS